MEHRARANDAGRRRQGDAARRAKSSCQLSVVSCPLQGKPRAIRIKLLLKYFLLATDYCLLNSLSVFPDT
jgi:hypothetical protein